LAPCGDRRNGRKEGRRDGDIKGTILKPERFR
jgi:hypothetical protein